MLLYGASATSVRADALMKKGMKHELVAIWPIGSVRADALMKKGMKLRDVAKA